MAGYGRGPDVDPRWPWLCCEIQIGEKVWLFHEEVKDGSY